MSLQLSKAYQDSKPTITMEICFEFGFSQNDIVMSESENASMSNETLDACKNTKGLHIEMDVRYNVHPDDPCIFQVVILSAHAALSEEDPSATDGKMDRSKFITDVSLDVSQWYMVCTEFLKYVPEDLRKFSNAKLFVVSEVQSCPENLIAALREIYP